MIWHPRCNIIAGSSAETAYLLVISRSNCGTFLVFCLLLLIVDQKAWLLCNEAF